MLLKFQLQDMMEIGLWEEEVLTSNVMLMQILHPSSPYGAGNTELNAQ